MFKNIKFIISGIVGIFLSYFIVQPIVIDTSYFQLNNLIIPFLWSLFYIFLRGKNHILISINSYIIFLLFMLAEKINFGGLSTDQVLVYTIFTMGIAFLFTLIYQELYFLKKIKITFFMTYMITFIFYLLPISFIIYRLNFDTAVTKDILYAVFQTNISEAIEQILDSISIQWLILFLFLSFLLGFILYKQEKKETNKIERSLLIFIITLFITISMVEIKNLTLPKFIIDNFNSYNKELKSFETNSKKRKNDNNITAIKLKNNETYIVIIGESLNKKHMNIYGYFRDTTPNLTKLKKNNELLIFNNTYPNYVHTGPALSFALTRANQINKIKFEDAVSIIELLKKANVETYWLTNQGLGNDIVSLIAKKVNHLISVNNSRNISESYSFDEKLLPPLKKILEKQSNKNRVIFVHLMGSHAQYVARYPHSRFNYFKNNFKTIEVGKLANISHTFSLKWLYEQIKQIKDFMDFKSLIKKIIGVAQKRYNYYDNSVLYNDYIVSNIINLVKQIKGPNGVIYFSDHGEDITHQLAHNASKFTFEMTQIPMIMWFSNEYKKIYSDKYKLLYNHQDTLFSNGFIYETLIGILDIKTNSYNSRFDLSSMNYHLSNNEAYILHGKLLYTANNNFFFWKQENTKFLKDNNTIDKIVPKKINTIGKLKEIIYQGYKSFSINATWNENKNELNVDLNSLFSSVKLTKLEKIILFVKNINLKNLNNFLDYIKKIDEKLNIKKNIILVLNKNDNRITSKLKQSDYKIGYILSSYTKDIKNIDYILINEKDYNYFMSQLNYIDNNKSCIVITKRSLENNNFKDVINEKFYQDSIVKYILVEYKSLFE